MEPVLLRVTASRLVPLLVLVGCLLLVLGLVWLVAGPRRQSLRPWARRLAPLVGAGLGAAAVWASLRLVSPSILLEASAEGVTASLATLPAGASGRLSNAPAAVFIPWRAVDSIRLERLQAFDGKRTWPCDVLAFQLRPGFEALAAAGLVVAPGVRRSSLDWPLPRGEEGPGLLAGLRGLQQRFSSR